MAESYFKQPSSTQSHFAQVPTAEIERSKFDRSHGHKTTMDFGHLVPIMVDEVLPGDTYHLQTTAFGRLATQLKPVMDNMFLDLHFFFIPNRLIWDHWQNFMGERVNIDDDPADYSIPQTTINMATNDDTKLANHMGIPFMPSGSISVSALPFRAYLLTFNEWYRDQNLTNSFPLNTGDGPDNWAAFGLMLRGKRHDYFSSALPYPQKGDPVYVPLGTQAPVVTNFQNPQFAVSGMSDVFNLTVKRSADGTNVLQLGPPATAVPGTATNALFGAVTGLAADLTAATAITINDLRTAFQIQRLLERDARSGSRYIELVYAHFGVQSPDLRATRPIYLGGGTSAININPVAQTVPVVDESPQANLAAYGTVVGKGGFTQSFTEHGILLGLASARADMTYQNGIERFWSRKTRYDFYFPALAHLGEQAILNKEIFCSGVPLTDDAVWGYQERHGDYRYKPSRVTGKFCSNDPESLDYWHLAFDFTSLPPLNDNFIREQPPIDRIIAVPSEPHLLLDVWFNLQCDRPMPVYAVPGLVDHF